jgi:ADP-ribose diphosphatase
MIKRISEKEIFKTKLFAIKDVNLETPKGLVTYQILEKKDTALIVPINEERQVIFVKEYFTAIDEYSLSLPKGRIDEGHDDLSTANKELQEEIGYKANKIEKLGILTMSPGYLTQKTHVFLAQDLEESKLEGDEAEELEIVVNSFSKFEELIEKGEISEARVIAALYLAKKRFD